MRGSHRQVFFPKTFVFLRQRRHLAAEFLNLDKIDCQKPGADLSTRELGIPNLDKSSQAEQRPSAGTKCEKNAFPHKRGTPEITERHFLEISSIKIARTKVFHGQEALFEGCSFPMWFFRGPETNKQGSQELQIENHEFYQGKDDILVGRGARTP